MIIPTLLFFSGTSAHAAKKKGAAAPTNKPGAPAANSNPLDFDADAPLPPTPGQPAPAAAPPSTTPATQSTEPPVMSNTTWDDKPAKPAEPPAEATSAPEETRPPLFDLYAGLGFINRNFDYSGNQGAQVVGAHLMPKYNLAFAPQLLVGGQLYPLARATTGFLGDLGIAASLAYPFLSKSKLPDGSGGTKEYDTRGLEVLVGLRYRFRVEKLEIQGGVDYGLHEFAIDGQPDPPTATNPGIPKVAYRIVRPSISGRYPIAEFISLLAGVGFRGVIGAGQIVSRTYFRAQHTSEWGLDAHAGAGLLLFPNLELRAAVGLTLYSYAMTPGFQQGTDTFKVDGASDLYLTGGVTLAYTK